LFQLRERDVRLSNISAEDLSKAVSELSLSAHTKVNITSVMLSSLSLFHCDKRLVCVVQTDCCSYASAISSSTSVYTSPL